MCEDIKEDTEDIATKLFGPGIPMEVMGLMPSERPQPAKTPHMEATATAMSEYVAKFLARRFPAGLPEEMLAILSDIVIDAFEDGAAWSDREAMRQDVMVAPKQIIMP